MQKPDKESPETPENGQNSSEKKNENQPGDIRTRLTKRSVEIVQRYQALGIPTKQVIENALCLGELNLSLSRTTLGDVEASLRGVANALREYNLIRLETDALLEELELILEQRELLRCLEEEITRKK